jgi:hypothetical protein
LSSLTIAFELDQPYDANAIGHFRVFCLLHLKEPKHRIIQILFGSSDKSDRMRDGVESGIKYGVSGGQWEQRIDLESVKYGQADAGLNDSDEDEGSKFTKVGSSFVGVDPVQLVAIRYSHDSFIRLQPRLSLRDLDEAMLLPILNKSLSVKVKAIHIDSNGYKLQKVSREQFGVRPLSLPYQCSFPTMSLRILGCASALVMHPLSVFVSLTRHRSGCPRLIRLRIALEVKGMPIQLASEWRPQSLLVYSASRWPLPVRTSCRRPAACRRRRAAETSRVSTGFLKWLRKRRFTSSATLRAPKG